MPRINSGCDLTALLVCVHDVGLSDHQLLTWSVAAHRPAPPVVSVVRRPWHKLLLMPKLYTRLCSRHGCQPDSWTDCTVSQLADQYNHEITSILDMFIPAKTVTTRRRPSDTWFDQECHQSKRKFSNRLYRFNCKRANNKCLIKLCYYYSIFIVLKLTADIYCTLHITYAKLVT